MAIQWYPGHMHKANKEIKEILPQVDIIIEVLDARIPFSSENPLITENRGNKPCIKVLNKFDLADPAILELWKDYFEHSGNVRTITNTSDQPGQSRQIIDMARSMVGKAKVTAMIAGIPNVGKSTLINTLAGRVIAKTGNEPAVTKHQQRIRIEDDFTLLDTPGMLWPNIENEHSGYRLAITGGIKNTAFDYTDIAWYAAGYMLSAYPELLRARYQFDELPRDEEALFELIGRQRGALQSGGRIDLERTCNIFLHELRDGTLGRYTLETPAMREQELVQVEIQRQKKEEKKQARLEAKQAQRLKARKNRK